MMHRSKVEWPCLSVDYLVKERCTPEGVANPKSWFDQTASHGLDPAKTKMDKHKRARHVNDKFPMQMYMVAGSQAEKKADNKIYVMKWDEMAKTVDEDNVDSDDDNSDDDKKNYVEPVIRYESLPHKGAINRIRSMHGSPIVATWSEDAEVGIYNITPAL